MCIRDRDMVERMLGPDGANALFREVWYDAGYNFGLMGVKLIKETVTTSDPKQLLEAYIKLEFTVRGWGRFEVVKFDPNKPEVVLGAYDTYTKELGIQSSTVPKCYFRWGIAGAIKAILEETGFKGEIEVEETKCVAKGTLL